jgi:F-type H+-transporting ATPase subunit epsilon
MSGDEASALRLKIITPKRLLADVEAESVSIPSLEGEIGILPGHRPLVVGIGKGRVSFRAGGREESFVIEGGVARVEPNEVLVMTEEAEDEGPGEKSA